MVAMGDCSRASATTSSNVSRSLNESPCANTDEENARMKNNTKKDLMLKKLFLFIP
jgi:hypothetical protein